MMVTLSAVLALALPFASAFSVPSNAFGSRTPLPNVNHGRSPFSMRKLMDTGTGDDVRPAPAAVGAAPLRCSYL